jgi:hypothetical protein
MVVRLVAAVVGLGGMVVVDGDRLVCRMPKGVALPPEVADGIRAHKAAIVAALAVAPLEETVRYIQELSAEERAAFAAALAHDLAAFATVDGGCRSGVERGTR